MLWDSTNLDVSAAMKRGQPKAGKKAYGKTPTPWQMDAVTKAAEQHDQQVMLIDHPRGSGKTREIAKLENC